MHERKKPIQLHNAHRRQITDRVSAIYSLWSDLTVFPWTHNKAQQLLQLSHSLVGVSDSVGAVTVSRLASELDAQLQKMVGQSAAPPDEQQRKALARLVTALQRISDVGAVDADSGECDSAHQAGLLIYIVDSDKQQAEAVAVEIAGAGYKTQIFSDIQAFKAAYITLKKPAAIVIGMTFSGCGSAGARVIDSLRRDHASTMPVIFISERSDIESRLLALRAGAVHYLVKPANYKRLVRHLDEATMRSSLKPFRVLLVDDDRSLLGFHSALLEEKGMLTSVLSDPLQTLDVIRSFNPDVIILDIYMPGCSGIELAMILNDDEFFAEIPLLFLSLEQDQKNQLAALSIGGDGFLSKPVDPQNFIQTVKVRARKGRRIRELHDDLRHALNKRLISKPH